MGKEVATAMKDLEVQEKAGLREQIGAFEDLIGQQEGAFFGDTINCPLTHKFADGIYVREMFVPAGTFLVGKLHKHTHPIFLMSGIAEIVSETAGCETFEGPVSMISPHGTKRAIHSITDIVIITMHLNPTNTQDLDELEKMIIAEDYDQYEKFISKKESKVVRLINRIVSSVQLKLMKT